MNQTAQRHLHGLVRIHLWQIQSVRDVLLIGAAYGLLYLGYVLQSITVPMLVALGLAYISEPLIQRMMQWRFYTWSCRGGGAWRYSCLILSNDCCGSVGGTTGAGISRNSERYVVRIGELVAPHWTQKKKKHWVLMRQT